MIKRVVLALLRLFRAASASSVARLLATLHASIFVLCIANMSPPSRDFADSLDRLYASGGGSSAVVFAGRPFHFNYESVPLQLMMLVDMPAEVIANASLYAVQSALWFQPRVYVQSWL